MKKEEVGKSLNPTREIKYHEEYKSKSCFPRAYLGCDTCKFKNIESLEMNKSVCKIGDYNCNVTKNKSKSKSNKLSDSEKCDLKSRKVKLTDLCYDDKKRIIELIEELSKFAEKNQKLNEMLDCMQKSRQEQQDYIMKQANLHLEEKNFYINEINSYKSKLEAAENELKNRVLLWEKQERVMNTEIAYLSKALKESVNEKNELNDQMNNLRIYLRQSLESFGQSLRNEIIVLQQNDKPMKKLRVGSTQTESTSLTAIKDKALYENVDLEDEFISMCSQNSTERKSSLDVINDKLEHVYQLLKRKGETYEKTNLAQKFDIDLSILLRNDKLTEVEKMSISNFQDEMSNGNDEMEERTNSAETSQKFLKPFDRSSKMSVKAERILSKIGRPLNLQFDLPRDLQTTEIDKTGKRKKLNGAWLEKTVQVNKLYRSEDAKQHYEEKLLEDLFYTSGNLKLDVMDFIQDKDGNSKMF